jgi:diguanylate cyclase (GGDEF)-like protein/PAS domain S-box-containing protein
MPPSLHRSNLGEADDVGFLAAVIDSNPDGIAVLDWQGRVVFFNHRYAELWGFEPDRLAGMTPEERLAWQLPQLAQPEVDLGQFDVRIASLGQSRCDLFQLKDGRWIERRSYDHLLKGKKAGLIIHLRDVTADHESTLAAEHQRELMHAMMDSVPDQIFFKDTQNRFIRINPTLAARYGLTDPALAVGKSDADFYAPDVAAKFAAVENEIMRTGLPILNVLDHEIWADGKETWNVVSKMPLRDPKGLIIGTYGIAHDITEHKRTEALIWQQANYDALTGLPNRRLLHDRWMQAVKNQQRGGQGLALLMIDLDHFKDVNDSLGHARGDDLLTEAAQRISNCLRASDTVARLGGDEFAVILTDLGLPAHAGEVAQKIVDSMSQPFALGADQVFVSASVGVTYSAEAPDQIDELFKQADQSMYVAKAQGRNGYVFYTPDLQLHPQTRLQITSDLHVALAKNQLFLVYQPIVDLTTGEITKAEALLRWQHPKRGLISPTEFIPLAESSGLIVEIGEWVFRQAAKQVSEWRTNLSPQIQIAVNKSPLQFHNRNASPQHWMDHLRELGVSGDAIVVEITEGLLLDASTQVQEQLVAMRDTGMKVSLDDFGTGYSSLSYLQRYDIDFIKIDQSFVRDLHADSRNMALCKAIISMAHALGMKVVAEGVETPEQRDLLTQAGCDYGQGYLFSRPLSVSAMEVLLQAAPKNP